ncbi:MAG: trigger factor [Anaerolineales bacterium]
MKIETQYLENQQAKLIVEIDPEPLEKAKRQAARKISKRMKIPGFRPGKAPYGVVVRHVGEGTILEDALDILLKDIYPKAIEEADIEPYGPGNLENFSMDPPTFEFVVPLQAETELGEYRTLRIPYEPPKVTDDEFYESLQNLRERYAYLKSMERPAEEGDLVHVVLSSQRVEGTTEEQDDDLEDPTQLKDVTNSVEIEPEGSDNDDWPFLGFSRHLIGLAPEDEKTISHTFPDDATQERLQGVEAEYQIRIDNIQSRILPELDDEFAQMVSEHDTMDELRKEIRSSMEQEAQEKYDSGFNEQIIEKLIEEASFKYPTQMVEDEIKQMRANLESQITRQGLSMDTYYQIREIDEDGLIEELTPAAEERIKSNLVLLEVANQEDIQVDPNELQQETDRVMETLREVLSPDEAQKLDDNTRYSNVLSNVWMDMVKLKTIERLRAIAKGEVPPEKAGEESQEVEAGSEDETTDVEDSSQELSEPADQPVTEKPAGESDPPSANNEKIETKTENKEPVVVQSSQEEAQPTSDDAQEEV